MHSGAKIGRSGFARRFPTVALEIEARFPTSRIVIDSSCRSGLRLTCEVDPGRRRNPKRWRGPAPAVGDWRVDQK